MGAVAHAVYFPVAVKRKTHTLTARGAMHTERKTKAAVAETSRMFYVRLKDHDINWLNQAKYL